MCFSPRMRNTNIAINRTCHLCEGARLVLLFLRIIFLFYFISNAFSGEHYKFYVIYNQTKGARQRKYKSIIPFEDKIWEKIDWIKLHIIISNDI